MHRSDYDGRLPEPPYETQDDKDAEIDRLNAWVVEFQAEMRKSYLLQQAEIDRLRAALRYYARGQHIVGFSHWEGPSGDENWLCPPGPEDACYERFLARLDEHMVEDGSIARAALRGDWIDWEGEEPAPIDGETPNARHEGAP